jgi:squalene-hopene/tetraprenyl-beta-curcumene cyclase
MRRLQQFAVLLLVATLLPLSGCGKPAVQETSPAVAPSRLERLDQGLASASRFLIGRQDADGAWRSDIYATFRDGPALTPLAASALFACPHSAEPQNACRKGAKYLANMVNADGTIDAGPHGLSYPVYISAQSVVILSRPGNESLRKSRDAWLRYLRERQLTEELGWQPADAPYGGWGYCSGLPRKPKPGEFGPPFIESNLSATVFALDALRAAGVASDDPAIVKALVFVKRCQNFSDNPQERDSCDDGGFFFIYDDPVRNKAGRADSKDRPRFLSYGSTTADGLRGLLLCGLAMDNPRVAAARNWLATNFRAETHPGKYESGRELNREAIYYYYCASAATALRLTGAGKVEGKGDIAWAERLADELLKRQRPDGSWQNPAHAFREDDPMTATSMATMALAQCRAVLTNR